METGIKRFLIKTTFSTNKEQDYDLDVFEMIIGFIFAVYEISC